MNAWTIYMLLAQVVAGVYALSWAACVVDRELVAAYRAQMAVAAWIAVAALCHLAGRGGA